MKYLSINLKWFSTNKFHNFIYPPPNDNGIDSRRTN